MGQLVSPNTPVVTISNSNLEIDVNIPEIDLSNAKIGADSNVTLDAYGNDVNFPATIFSIDSAPSIVNGVTVYGTRLKFKNLDNKIKSGMTANVVLISETHKNVLTIPKSAVIQNDSKSFVILDKGNSQKKTVEVKTGLHDDKNIEIISGLKMGDKVFAY